MYLQNKKNHLLKNKNKKISLPGRNDEDQRKQKKKLYSEEEEHQS